MIFRPTAFAALLLTAACAAAPVPDSNPESGVGFGGYDAYATERARRDAELQAMRRAPVPEERVIASETMAVLGHTQIAGTAVQSPTGEPLSAIPATAGVQVATAPVAGVATTPLAGTSNPSISDEQNFDAVSSRESIQSDAERLAANRQAYQVVAPTALPERTGEGGTNIVAYALSTTNRRGEAVYERGRFDNAKFQRACGQFASSDQAQRAFLEGGGPVRDRRGLDPDGDGFACFWDPAPFRTARGG